MTTRGKLNLWSVSSKKKGEKGEGGQRAGKGFFFSQKPQVFQVSPKLETMPSGKGQVGAGKCIGAPADASNKNSIGGGQGAWEW